MTPSSLSCWAVWSMSILASLPRSSLHMVSGEMNPSCERSGGILGRIMGLQLCPIISLLPLALPTSALQDFLAMEKGYHHFSALLARRWEKHVETQGISRIPGKPPLPSTVIEYHLARYFYLLFDIFYYIISYSFRDAFFPAWSSDCSLICGADLKSH